jgi:hypothetical protein
MKKVETTETPQKTGEPAPEKSAEKYKAVLMPPERDHKSVPVLGIDLLNQMHLDGWEFMFFRYFGVNENYAYFKRLDA